MRWYLRASPWPSFHAISDGTRSASRRVARAVHAWARGDHEAAVASASAALMFERSELAQAVLQSIRQASSWPSGSFAASAPQSPILTGLDGDPVQTSAS